MTATDDTVIIKTQALTKTFGPTTAVKDLNLEVMKGELFGLVGPDGAGKTTIMRLLTAIMDPTSGEAWIAGHSILSHGETIKEEIGYMSQRFGLYEDLTVMENIDFYADLYGVPGRERPPRIERLLGFSNLTPFKDRLAGKLSGGMKQKLGLACALIHTPRVLFLDEPTNGVDPVSRRDFWKILYDLLKEEITVFVSTAYLDEAERCTRIGLIHKGSLLMVEEPARVKEALVVPMIEVFSPNARAAREVLAAMEDVESVSIYGDRLHIAIKAREAISRVIDTLTAKGVEVEGHREILPSLEDVFIALVKES
ncbi:MAG: putative ABC transporter ATP-binding protein YbhF [Syntrophorhabdus sp. PtaU1.Bin002]|nr:MAG: putative ABC transporter ATP-binding protein YbhF [Syntrophorhabdus sp. PtaB.Bin006]OPY66205.1 MAG: putative ABC transporter ATP-binding protein YbhF [Syntrophorhabdus sp. PtaU1.Bin002]